MTDDTLKVALAVAASIGALKFKNARVVGTRGGVEVHQHGKPTLLLTHAAAVEFYQARQEAEAND